MKKIMLTTLMIAVTTQASLAQTLFSPFQMPHQNQTIKSSKVKSVGIPNSGKFGVKNATSEGQVEIGHGLFATMNAGTTSPDIYASVVAHGQQTLFDLVADQGYLQQVGEIQVDDSHGLTTTACYFSVASTADKITNNFYPSTFIVNTSGKYHCSFDKTSIDNDGTGNSVIVVADGADLPFTPIYQLTIHNELADQNIQLSQMLVSMIAIKPQLHDVKIGPNQSAKFAIKANYHDAKTLGYGADLGFNPEMTLLLSAIDQQGDKHAFCAFGTMESYNHPGHLDVFANQFIANSHDCHVTHNGNEFTLTIK